MSKCTLDLDVRKKSQLHQPNSENHKPNVQRSFTNKPLYEVVTWTDESGNTDTAARKAVRSHAMRHSRLRQDQSNSPCEVRHSPDSLVENHSQTLEDEFKTYIATMPHKFSTFDPFDCMPVRIRPYMLELFNKCEYPHHFSEIPTESFMLTSRHDLRL